MRGKYTAIFAVFVFIVFFFPMEARAVDWKFCVTSAGGRSLYYDPQSIKRVSKDIMRVWVKEVYTEKSVQEKTKELGPEYKELSCSIYLMEYSRSEKTCRTLSQTYYNQNGDVISSFDDPSSWYFVVPGSAGELLFNIVCGGR